MISILRLLNQKATVNSCDPQNWAWEGSNPIHSWLSYYAQVDKSAIVCYWSWHNTFGFAQMIDKNYVWFCIAISIRNQT